MEIIDNFGLAAKRNTQNFQWLERILQRVQELSQKSFVLRLSGEPRGHDTQFKLNNGTNKTSALLWRRHGNLLLSLSRRNVPDPEVGFKPALVTLQDHVLAFNEASLHQIPELLIAHLDQDTPYSLNQVVRVKVTPTAYPLEPWTFAGGRITAIDESNPQALKVTVEDGLQTYTVRPSIIDGASQPAVCKYLLMNDDGEFEFVGSREFDFYFQMKYVNGE